MGKKYLCYFIDMSKAYDMVPHKQVLRKLMMKHIGVKVITALKGLYINARAVVKSGNEYCLAFKYNKGLRQGCPTSPLVFNVFIDDILDGMKKVHVPGLEYKVPGLCFADDCVLLAENKSEAGESLEILLEWCKKNCMEVNAGKLNIMYFNETNDE